jgi:rhamnosyltransferase
MTNTLSLSCCAIVISYNPTLNLVKAVNSLSSQFSFVIIIDNGSQYDSISILRGLEAISNVSIKYNEDNLGIATALNQGIKCAENMGYEWVGTFDQDSLAPPNYLETMIAAYEDCEDHTSVAMISPIYLTTTGLVSFSDSYRDNNLNKYRVVKTTMTSGNIIKTSIFKAVGDFDESFFIDYVDHEFCLRLRKNGFKIIESCSSFLHHQLGDSVIYKFAGISITSSNHSHTRRYYKYRNMVKVFKKYTLFDVSIVYPMLKSLFVEPLKIVLLEKEKYLKMKYILKGVSHGFAGVSGKIPN